MCGDILWQSDALLSKLIGQINRQLNFFGCNESLRNDFRTGPQDRRFRHGWHVLKPPFADGCSSGPAAPALQPCPPPVRPPSLWSIILANLASGSTPTITLMRVLCGCLPDSSLEGTFYQVSNSGAIGVAAVLLAQPVQRGSPDALPKRLGPLHGPPLGERTTPDWQRPQAAVPVYCPTKLLAQQFRRCHRQAQRGDLLIFIGRTGREPGRSDKYAVGTS
jgi:hypothetical protein